MKIVYSPDHAKHHPKTYIKAGSFHEPQEVPGRAEALSKGLNEAGHEFIDAKDYGPAPRAAIHTPGYLHFLETIADRWRAAGMDNEEVLPNIHPGRHMPSYPTGIIGEVGYYTTDLSAPIGPETWEGAVASSNVALTATDIVLDDMSDNAVAYGLCRPPGHHAYQDQAGGFCFLNNIAIAAQHALSKVKRVAILDVDVHHGNGTQGIFYNRKDVFTVSLHCDPIDYYPFFAGHAHERGEGDGDGFNLNVPIPPNTGDDVYLEYLETAKTALRAFAPDVLFVALGLDAFEGDPLDGLSITTEGFGRMAASISELNVPTVLIQEGGYNRDHLGANIVSFLKGFEG
ncbi:histone deacetylase family protein [Sneathiella sp. P13V-1]|uniref:histone deacetylase family protein n=1 Tax=Sneathiella sp. P13V-1 TaxID=2697366 RepID=UPI00187BBA5E|nr:histone deacetylase family protein [Sneathiella sp. P13V-1]MBE7638469.1 histone deacetylase family protein [Sneathiella sp. P13V-1]